MYRPLVGMNKDRPAMHMPVSYAWIFLLANCLILPIDDLSQNSF